MARMIPPVLDPATPSPGEKMVFERLRDAPGTEHWTVLHSVSLPRHLRQVEGEVDFVILVPALGVLCLEVKAHRHVKRDENGMWHLGSQKPTGRSPFRQASDAMHSLRAALIDRAPDLRAVPFTSAVCFTHVDFDVRRPEEWHEWQVLGARAFLSRPIKVNIEKILRAARKHYADSGHRWLADTELPTTAMADLAARLLRPAFEIVETRKTARAHTLEDLRRFTEEQFDALDALAATKRILFNGPAGTGKTFLAIEAARRAVLEDQRVLLCCYNRPLGSWLKKQLQDERLVVGTFHSYLLKAAGNVDVGEDPGWWSHTLPELALDKMLDGGSEFDLVVVDEAQDLLTDRYLDCLDLSLRGGLAGGRWLMFSDIARQSLYKCGDGTALLRQRAPDYVPYELLSNCRNTPSVAEYTTTLAGLESGYRRILRPENGHLPRTYFYVDSAGQGARLAEVFSELRRARVEPADVVLLSRNRENEAVGNLPELDPWKHRIGPMDTAHPGWAKTSTIFGFKGLEAPVVILCGLDDVLTEQAQSLMYVALSRATERLYVLANDHVKETLGNLVRARSFGNGFA